MMVKSNMQTLSFPLKHLWAEIGIHGLVVFKAGKDCFLIYYWHSRTFM
jgi:hypothetical protein